MSIGGWVKHKAHQAKHAAKHAADEAKKTAKDTAHKAEQGVEHISEEALKELSGIGDGIKKDIEHLGDGVKSDIQHLLNKAIADIKHEADQAKKDITAAERKLESEAAHVVDTAKDAIHKAFDEILHKLEDAVMMFGKAVEDGLIQKSISEAIDEIEEYPIEPASFTIGFEFWNVGFGVDIDDIPDKLVMLKSYADGHPLKSAKDIEEFVLALAPTGLSVTVFGNGPSFDGHQVGDAIVHVLNRFGIK